MTKIALTEAEGTLPRALAARAGSRSALRKLGAAAGSSNEARSISVARNGRSSGQLESAFNIKEMHRYDIHGERHAHR